MSLTEKVQAEMKQAMLSKDQAKLRGLRAVKSAILLAQTEKSGAKELSEEKELEIVQKLLKQRKDSLAIYEEQGRDDLAQKEKEEIEVIEKFLPEQLSEEEVKDIVQNIIDETGASSMKDMGKVMGMATKRLAGKADNKTVADLVKSMLS